MRLLVGDYLIKKKLGEFLTIDVTYILRVSKDYVTPEIVKQVMERIFEGIEIPEREELDDPGIMVHITPRSLAPEPGDGRGQTQGQTHRSAPTDGGEDAPTVSWEGRGLAEKLEGLDEVPESLQEMFNTMMRGWAEKGYRG